MLIQQKEAATCFLICPEGMNCVRSHKNYHPAGNGRVAGNEHVAGNERVECTIATAAYNSRKMPLKCEKNLKTVLDMFVSKRKCN